MARSLNKVMLIGNLGADAETRYTQGGTAVTNFRIATSRRFKDQSGDWREDTDWHDIVLWRGENVAPYLTKGTQVYVEGRLQTRSYEDQQGQKRYRTEVVADNFNLMLLGGRGGGGGADFDDAPRSSAPPRRSSEGGAPSRDEGMGVEEDDVPF